MIVRITGLDNKGPNVTKVVTKYKGNT